MIRGPGHLGYRGPTGGIPRDPGAESVGYMGDPTGGILRDSGPEFVGYIGDGRWWRRGEEEKRISL